MKSIRSQRLALALGALLAVAAAPPAPPAAPPAPAGESDIVAQRGDAKLTVAEVRGAIDRLEAPTRLRIKSDTAALATFVRDEMLRISLLNEARAKGIDQLPDVIAKANDARDRVIVSEYLASLVPPDPNFPSQAEIAATYESNKTKFIIPKQYHLAQIAFLTPPGATQAAIDEAKRHAAEARALAVKPPADFADVARKLSQDPTTAPRGGEIGWVREDQLQPALRPIVAAMGDNAVSEPVQTSSAWVVLKVLGTKPSAPATLAEVQDQIIAAMRQSRAQQATQSYINDMLRKEPIRLNEIDLARKIVGPRTQ